MAYMAAYLHKRGYKVCYRYNSDKKLTSLLFAHPNFIKNAVRFSEVVVIDATYKTNLCKTPYVNVVGISNVGTKHGQLQSFAMASAHQPLIQTAELKIKIKASQYRLQEDHLYRKVDSRSVRIPHIGDEQLKVLKVHTLWNAIVQ